MKHITTYQNYKLLLESLASAKARFGNQLDDYEYNSMAELDPTPTKKYLEKMIEWHLNGHYISTITPYINKFNNLVNRNVIDIKDINQFKTYKDFMEYVDKNANNISKTETQRLIKAGGAKVVYEDDKYLIVFIKNKEACMLYGSGTKWCITQKDSDYWRNYNSSNTFYFILNKNLSNRDPFYKIAVQVDDNTGEPTFWDAEDDKYDTTEFLEATKYPIELLKYFKPLDTSNFSISDRLIKLGCTEEIDRSCFYKILKKENLELIEYAIKNTKLDVRELADIIVYYRTDINVSKYLKHLFKLRGSEFDKKKIYLLIKEAKYDRSGISIKVILEFVKTTDIELFLPNTNEIKNFVFQLVDVGNSKALEYVLDNYEVDVNFDDGSIIRKILEERTTNLIAQDAMLLDVILRHGGDLSIIDKFTQEDKLDITNLFWHENWDVIDVVVEHEPDFFNKDIYKYDVLIHLIPSWDGEKTKTMLDTYLGKDVKFDNPTELHVDKIEKRVLVKIKREPKKNVEDILSYLKKHGWDTTTMLNNLLKVGTEADVFNLIKQYVDYNAKL